MDSLSRVSSEVIPSRSHSVMFRNAELWGANLDELPPTYVPPESDQTWGLGWFKP